MTVVRNIFFFFGLLTTVQLITANILNAACGGKPKHCKKQLETHYDLSPDKQLNYGVRCCSEEQFLNAEKKEKFGCEVWAGSKDANHQCMDDAPYQDAVDFCASMGARLCTCNEVLTKCAKGTGCGLNKKLVWCDNPPMN